MTHQDKAGEFHANPVPPPYPAGGPGPYPAGAAQYAASSTTYTYQVQPHGINPNIPPQQNVVFALQSNLLGPNPSLVMCPSCNQQVMSVTEFENGTLTWLWVGGLALLGCWLGCCFIPLCINETKDVLHTCPNCRNFLGRYKRLN